MAETLDKSLTHTVKRTDGFELLKAPYQDSYGRWLVEGIVARPGIYEYQDVNGTRRELVSAEALSRTAFLDGLKGVPVTIEHPPVEVTPENNKQFSVGTCLSADIVDGGAVKVCLVVSDAAGVDFLTKQRVSGLSPHYYADTRPSPGNSEFYGAYDSVQVSREKPNHIALTKSPRGGHQTSVRLDSQINPHLDGAQMEVLKAKLLESGMDPEQVAKVMEVVMALAEKGAEPEVEVEVKAEDEMPAEEPVMDMKGMYDALEGRVKALEDMMAAKADADPESPAEEPVQDSKPEPVSKPVEVQDSKPEESLWDLFRTLKISR